MTQSYLFRHYMILSILLIINSSKLLLRIIMKSQNSILKIPFQSQHPIEYLMTSHVRCLTIHWLRSARDKIDAKLQLLALNRKLKISVERQERK